MARKMSLGGKFGLPTLAAAMKEKRPYLGVTQGGSSRKNSGAKPAATDGQRPSKNFKSVFKKLGV
jgi:hypothetical protein